MGDGCLSPCFRWERDDRIDPSVHRCSDASHHGWVKSSCIILNISGSQCVCMEGKHRCSGFLYGSCISAHPPITPTLPTLPPILPPILPPHHPSCLPTVLCRCAASMPMVTTSLTVPMQVSIVCAPRARRRGGHRMGRAFFPWRSLPVCICSPSFLNQPDPKPVVSRPAIAKQGKSPLAAS